MTALIVLGNIDPTNFEIEKINDRLWDDGKVPERDKTEEDLSSVLSRMQSGTDASMVDIMDDVDVFLLKSAIEGELYSFLDSIEKSPIFGVLKNRGYVESKTEEDCDNPLLEWKYWTFSPKAQARGEYLLQKFLEMF